MFLESQNSFTSYGYPGLGHFHRKFEDFLENLITYKRYRNFFRHDCLDLSLGKYVECLQNFLKFLIQKFRSIKQNEIRKPYLDTCNSYFRDQERVDSLEWKISYQQ